MISGAAQADIGVLVISARKGEFETGFERKGQTRYGVVLSHCLRVLVLDLFLEISNSVCGTY